MLSHLIGLEYLNRAKLEEKDKEIAELKHKLELYKHKFGELHQTTATEPIRFCNSEKDIEEELKKICR